MLSAADAKRESNEQNVTSLQAAEGKTFFCGIVNITISRKAQRSKPAGPFTSSVSVMGARPLAATLLGSVWLTATRRTQLS